MFDIHDDLRELIVLLREMRNELRKGQNADFRWVCDQADVLDVAASVIQKEIE